MLIWVIYGFSLAFGDSGSAYYGAFDLSGEQLRPDMTVRDDLLAPTSPAATSISFAANWVWSDSIERCIF